MSKTLFIENSPFLTRLVIADELKESIQVKQGKNNTLIVKNIPGTILNRTNQNGRIYSTAEIQKAIDAARPQIETKQLLCSCDEHPEGSFVSPSHAAFVIIGAYIKKNVKLEVEGEKGTFDVLFCDIEVLNTSEGKNLQALLLSGCSLGTSIRGLGDMDGDQVVNYEFLGFDIVSNPSSGTFTNMPIYEAKIESVEENALNEATKFTVSTYASNTTHDLQQAMDFQDKASTSLQYGTITNMNTKMDQEVDPKTGVEKTVGEVEVETSDDVSDLKTALEIAGRAFTNPENINVTSITIEKVDEDDIKDSVMQGGASDTLKEEPVQEESAGAKLYKRWNKELGGKNQIVLTSVGPFAIFPAYDGSALVYGHCNQNGLVDSDAVEGQVPYDPEDDLEAQVMLVANKVNEDFGYATDLFDSANKEPENELEEGKLGKAAAGLLGAGAIAGTLIGANELGKINQTKLDQQQVCAQAQDQAYADQEEARKYFANPESLNDVAKSVEMWNKYVQSQKDADAKCAEGNKEEAVLKEEEITQGMWIKTELLDPTAVYYVDEVTDDCVYLIKNSENGPRIPIKTDGSFIFPWEEVKDEEGMEEANTDGTIEQNDETLTIDVDGNEVEKEFRTPEEARVAKAGLENGELTADVMYDESGSWWGLKVSAGDYADWYVTDEGNGVDVTADENMALVFPTEEEAKKFQQENGCEEYEYQNGLRASVTPVQMGITDEEIFGKQEEANMDEKLYANEDPASDEFQQEPVTEEIKDLKVTLGDIAYDVDEEPDFEGDPSEIENILNELPETIVVELNGVDVPENDAEQFIYQKACEQTGLPIKNATIIDIEEVEKEEVKEDGEEGMDMDATADMSSDDMGGLEGDSGMADEADVGGGDDMGGEEA